MKPSRIIYSFSIRRPQGTFCPIGEKKFFKNVLDLSVELCEEANDCCRWSNIKYFLTFDLIRREYSNFIILL